MNMETRSEPTRWWKLAPVYSGSKLNKYRVNKHELRHLRWIGCRNCAVGFPSKSAEITSRTSAHRNYGPRINRERIARCFTLLHTATRDENARHARNRAKWNVPPESRRISSSMRVSFPRDDFILNNDSAVPRDRTADAIINYQSALRVPFATISKQINTPRLVATATRSCSVYFAGIIDHDD